MNNPPAFPHTVEYRGFDCGGIVPHGGMSLRDYFAAKAMQALVEKNYFDTTALLAYRMADAMLAARKKA